MKRKPGRPKRSELNQSISKRHYATSEEHAFIKNWLAMGGMEFERTGIDKRTKKPV